VGRSCIAASATRRTFALIAASIAGVTVATYFKPNSLPMALCNFPASALALAFASGDSAALQVGQNANQHSPGNGFVRSTDVSTNCSTSMRSLQGGRKMLTRCC
jgi:hypothetical protein